MQEVLCILLKRFNFVYGGVYVIANEFVIGEYNGRSGFMYLNSKDDGFLLIWDYHNRCDKERSWDKRLN